jgi:DNA polymerase III subunit epsilon
VRDYLLFIDTEASALPKKWDLPYSKEGNWPHSVQISWMIYTKDGNEVKQENFYISNNDFEISNSANKVHGITREFVDKKGVDRKEALALLNNDLNQYQPLIVGHFIELDFHLIGADAYRAGIQHPLLNLPTFCTMLATTGFVQNPAKKFLKLCDLYSLLFNAALPNHHNALEDARATAICFFELLKRGELDDKQITKQEKFLTEPAPQQSNNGCSFVLLSIFILMILTIIFL